MYHLQITNYLVLEFASQEKCILHMDNVIANELFFTSVFNVGGTFAFLLALSLSLKQCDSQWTPHLINHRNSQVGVLIVQLFELVDPWKPTHGGPTNTGGRREELLHIRVPLVHPR